jgi:hypothetical protein
MVAKVVARSAKKIAVGNVQAIHAMFSIGKPPQTLPSAKPRAM